jgi:hypothetical protein
MTGGQPQPGADASAAFSGLGEAGSLGSATSDPGIFGDLIGIQGQRVVVVSGSVSGGHTTQVVSGNKIAIVAPVPYHSSFKITENESPRPTDRVFVTYTYYNDVSRNFVGGTGVSDLHRETVGFEKTFLDKNASIGFRLPFLELVGGDEGIEDTSVADLSIIFKYAFINNRETNNVLSAGMVLTVPTGQGLAIEGDSTLRDTVFQPFVGYIYHLSPNMFIQGFSSIAVPTDTRDVTLMFNSIAACFWLYRDNERDARLRGIIPVVECHVNTPLDHRGLDAGPIGYPDAVDMTLGAHLLFRRAEAGFAVGFPVTGPKPYDVEAGATLNFRF